MATLNAVNPKFKHLTITETADLSAVSSLSLPSAISPSFTGGTFTGDVAVSKTSTATALGSTFLTQSNLTLTATGIVSGSGYALRCITTCSGTVTGGAFVAGLRAGTVFSGTMNHADSRVAAGIVKLDTGGATLTAGQLSALWVDHAVGVSGAGGGQFNMLRITNTVAGAKPNSQIYMFGDASFLFDVLSESTPSFYLAAGTSSGSAGKSDGCAAQKVLACQFQGAAGWIPVFTQNS